MLKIDRREFLEMTAAASVAAALRPAPAWAAGGLKKAVYVSMLPKELSYLDRFKLAREVGFEGVEVGTIADAAVAAEIKEAAAQAGVTIHGGMKADNTRDPPAGGG